MFQTLKSWLTAARTADTAARPKPRRFAPQIESLHDRITPNAYVLTSTGDLIVNGTDFADTSSVTQIGNFYRVTETDNRYIPSPFSTGPVANPPRITDIPVAGVTRLVFNGFARNDHFTNHTTLGLLAHGMDGNDTIEGGTGRSELYGEAGNDVLIGGTGSAFLFGGNDNDQLYGGNAADYLDGGYGEDSLNGGDGNDILYAGLDVGYGVDTLQGGNGNDYLYGSSIDPSYASLHKNIFYGGAGNDTLVGSESPDVLNGDSGADVLQGFGGNDTLVGGTGCDQLEGGDGNDWLDGGVGDGESDYLNGGLGADWFRRDMVYTSTTVPGGYAPAYNRDRPVDFNTNDDQFYTV